MHVKQATTEIIV